MVVQLWQACLGSLEQEFPSQQFNTWIRPLKAEPGDDAQLRLLAPNRFVKDWVSDKYLNRIKELLSEYGKDQIREVVLEVAGAGIRASSPAVHRLSTVHANTMAQPTVDSAAISIAPRERVIRPSSGIATPATIAVAPYPRQAELLPTYAETSPDVTAGKRQVEDA